MKYFLEIAYKGTNYHGWQVQINAITVQEVLDKALVKLFGITPPSLGCGRTDTGVHATVFFVQFETDSRIEDLEKACYMIDSILPLDIACKRMFEVGDDAHARFDANYRTYEYHLHQKKNPFIQDHSTFYSYDLDVVLMNQAAKVLLKHDDFASFCKVGSDNFTTLCDVMFAQWERKEDGSLVFTIKANRFLRNMVRAVVGTMFKVGRKQLSIEDFEEVLKTKNRSNAGASAKAKGLYLVDVGYDYV